MDLIPSETAAYYRSIAPRILPFLSGRPLTVALTGGRGLVRQHGGAPIRIASRAHLLEWIGRGAAGFFAAPLSWEGEVWFSIGLEAGALPFEAVRLTALKLHLVLVDHDLDALKYYDGAGGIRFLWTWGVPDPDEFVPALWEFQRRVARRLRDLLEARLRGTPERERIGRWLGFEGDVTRLEAPRIITGGATAAPFGDGGDDRIRFEFEAMAAHGFIRVPYSLHEVTGRAARPVSRADLFRFDPERDSTPVHARRLRRMFEIPVNFPRTVSRELAIR